MKTHWKEDGTDVSACGFNTKSNAQYDEISNIANESFCKSCKSIYNSYKILLKNEKFKTPQAKKCYKSYIPFKHTFYVCRIKNTHYGRFWVRGIRYLDSNEGRGGISEYQYRHALEIIDKKFSSGEVKNWIEIDPPKNLKNLEDYCKFMLI